MLLYFLVPLLNNLRFGFNNLDWRETALLNGLLVLGAILATVARYGQIWRLYLGLAGVNLLLFSHPFLFWLMMRGGVGVGPAYWRSQWYCNKVHFQLHTYLLSIFLVINA